MLRTVHLHGDMAEKFGSEFSLDVGSLQEATAALGAQIPGFRQYLVVNDFHCVRGTAIDDGIALGAEELALGLGRSDLHIVPALAGSKSGGIGKLIAGVLLAGVGFWMGPSTALIGGITWGNVATMGLAMAFAGLAQMLTPTPKKPPYQNSFIFNGALNTTDEGVPVPLIYGRTMVGSVVLSTAVAATDYPL